jgi:hypothetical protein
VGASGFEPLTPEYELYRVLRIRSSDTETLRLRPDTPHEPVASEAAFGSTANRSLAFVERTTKRPRKLTVLCADSEDRILNVHSD